MNKLSRTSTFVLIAAVMLGSAASASSIPATPGAPMSATIGVSAFVTDPVGVLPMQSPNNQVAVPGLRLPIMGEYIAVHSGGGTINLQVDTGRVVPLNRLCFPFSFPARGDTITVICTDN